MVPGAFCGRVRRAGWFSGMGGWGFAGDESPGYRGVRVWVLATTGRRPCVAQMQVPEDQMHVPPKSKCRSFDSAEQRFAQDDRFI